MFSLLLCTLNRPDLVEKCLESIFKQTYTNFEVIIVDQSLDDKTEKVCNKYIDNRIHYYKVNFKGLSKARNFGLKFAHGQYISLCDDDAIYSPGYLYSAHQFLASRGYPACALCGRATFCDEPDDVFDYSSFQDESRLSTQDILTMAYSPVLILPKNKLLELKGFDEEFGVGAKYGAGEETDILLRLNKNRIPLYYLERMKVRHGFKNQGDAELIKTYNYYVGTGALIKKHLVYLREIAICNKFMRLTLGAAVKWITGSKIQKSYYRERIRGFWKGFITYRYE